MRSIRIPFAVSDIPISIYIGRGSDRAFQSRPNQTVASTHTSAPEWLGIVMCPASSDNPNQGLRVPMMVECDELYVMVGESSVPAEDRCSREPHRSMWGLIDGMGPEGLQWMRPKAQHLQVRSRQQVVQSRAQIQIELDLTSGLVQEKAVCLSASKSEV